MANRSVVEGNPPRSTTISVSAPGVADLPWMAQKLAGLGIPFIIHRPHEFRDVISKYAHQLATYTQQVDS